MSDQLWTVLSSTITALLVVFFVDRIKAQADYKRAGGEERKSSSDAIESATRANIALNDPLTRRVQALEVKTTSLEVELTAVKKLNFDYVIGIKRLVRQILNARMQPVWVPEDFDWESVAEEDV